MGDGKCDNNSQCNKFECFWDGHDCDDIKGFNLSKIPLLPFYYHYIDKRASYHQRYRFVVSNNDLRLFDSTDNVKF